MRSRPARSFLYRRPQGESSMEDDLRLTVQTLQEEMTTIQAELRAASRVRHATLILVAISAAVQVINLLARWLDK